MASETAQATVPATAQDVAQDAAPRISFVAKHRNLLLGCLSVLGFFAAWQAVFLVVPFNKLFISKPDLIGESFIELLTSGDLWRDLAVSAVPFLYGFVSAAIVGVAIGIVMGWRVRVGYALDPLMTVFYASPLVALAPLVIVFFGVGVSGKALIIFMLSVFPFVFNAHAGVRAVDPLLINVVRSLGATAICSRSTRCLPVSSSS
jgi:NitT/TauT family transport system permease protein